MADAGPPIVLIAIGLVLWLAVNATVAGIAVQTVGVIVAAAGLLWLVIEIGQSRARRPVVREQPVVRERELR